MADVSSESKTSGESFEEFYSEVKEIEKRDSSLTPRQQIERLNRPGCSYFNLNPFDVLQVDPDTPMNEIKRKYRQLSLLCHPDKNPDDPDRSQKAFEAINKSYKTLSNEEGFKRCQEIVEEAKIRVQEMIKDRKKKLKKEGKPQVVEEDEPHKFNHAVYVQICKLFADLERLRRDQETREANDRKRKAQEAEEEKERAERDKEWQKNYEESRDGRIHSWREWNKAKKAKRVASTFKPPKTKMEQRPN